MAIHSSILAWRIPWTEEPGRLQSMGSQRVGHYLSDFQVTLNLGRWYVGKESAFNAGELVSIPGSGRSPGGGYGNPLQCSCLENPMDRAAWWATVHGVAKSRTRLSD